MLLAAAVRPQWVGEIETLPITGRDLLLAVDISGSMANDGKLVLSQNQLRAFVDALRKAC